METKIRKRFIDYGMGFPVVLLNVPMVNVEGVWTPKIKYKQLEEWVLLSLSRQSNHLTGSQVHFIRLHFRMTLQAFADKFSVSHVAVMAWEKAKARPARMSWSIEKDIRLFIQSKLSDKPGKLAELYIELTEHPAAEREEGAGVGPVNANSMYRELAAAR
jgi:hypothetical protein